MFNLMSNFSGSHHPLQGRGDIIKQDCISKAVIRNDTPPFQGRGVIIKQDCVSKTVIIKQDRMSKEVIRNDSPPL